MVMLIIMERCFTCFTFTNTFQNKISSVLRGSQAGVCVLVPNPTVQRRRRTCLGSHTC